MQTKIDLMYAIVKAARDVVHGPKKDGNRKKRMNVLKKAVSALETVEANPCRSCDGSGRFVWGGFNSSSCARCYGSGSEPYPERFKKE